MESKSKRFMVWVWRWNRLSEEYYPNIEYFKTLEEAKKRFDEIQISEMVAQVSVEVNDGDEWDRMYFKDAWKYDDVWRA